MTSPSFILWSPTESWKREFLRFSSSGAGTAAVILSAEQAMGGLEW